jgi:hypothetical protein
MVGWLIGLGFLLLGSRFAVMLTQGQNTWVPNVPWFAPALAVLGSAVFVWVWILHVRRRLVIHLAEWGPGPSTGDFISVTETVQGFIKNNRIEMQASDQILGALYPGLPKKLRVIYSYGNDVKRRVTVAHNDFLRLP